MVYKLKESQVDRQFFLRNTAMRAQPRAQQRPETFRRVDMDCVETVALFVTRLLAGAVANAFANITPLR
jgi:hypothetical protein